MAHDLIFHENKSTPLVVAPGAPASSNKNYNAGTYGKQTKRRPATEDEEAWMRANPGKWLRVDEDGNKPSDPGYKKTRMKGREHLVHTAFGGYDPEQLTDFLRRLDES